MDGFVYEQTCVIDSVYLQPFQEVSLAAREQYKLALQEYKAQLTPAQSAAITEERKQKLAKRKAIRRKKASVPHILSRTSVPYHQ